MLISTISCLHRSISILTRCMAVPPSYLRGDSFPGPHVQLSLQLKTCSFPSCFSDSFEVSLGPIDLVNRRSIDHIFNSSFASHQPVRLNSPFSHFDRPYLSWPFCASCEFFWLTFNSIFQPPAIQFRSLTFQFDPQFL